MELLLPAKPASPRSRHWPLAPRPEVVLVGASTGGPQALVALIGGLATVLPRMSACVTLHLPADLMPIVAEHVARTCRVATAVIAENQELKKGIVYFTPGDRHLTFERVGARIAVVLAPASPSEVCRGAIDAMFRSGAACHGAGALGIVLSGMGKDGLEGARAIVAAGGSVLAQDKATSAVWGMPGAVAKADLAAAILPPAEMAREILVRTAPFARLA